MSNIKEGDKIRIVDHPKCSCELCQNAAGKTFYINSILSLREHRVIFRDRYGEKHDFHLQDIEILEKVKLDENLFEL